jgi:hypothetical protein
MNARVTVDVRLSDDSALARLRHVRAFLAAVDQHFPEGIPLAYSAAIRAELEPLERAAAFEVTDISTEGTRS